MVKVSKFSSQGLSDSEAINAAVASAQNEFVQLEPRTYLLDAQVSITNKSCLGLIGYGKGVTVLESAVPQTQVWDANTNKTDARPDAVVLVDRVDGITIQGLSIHYTGEFYRKGDTYFGCVNGLLFANCSNTTALDVEVSGCNRNGISFAAYGLDALADKYYRGEIELEDIGLPTGNKAVNCYTHHNRVAGIAFQYQDDGLAQGCMSAFNGHPDDGGTGYGIVATSGSVNRVTFEANITNHNYRKGLDSHDAVSFRAYGNKMYGDRLFGFAVENRKFPCELVDIRNNEIHHDPSFRLLRDDDLKAADKLNLNQDYYRYTAIRVELKSQPVQKFVNRVKSPKVNITGNHINGITLDGRGSHRVIELRNNDKDISPVFVVQNNKVKATSVGYFVAAFGSADTLEGLGTLRIEDNLFDAVTVNECPVYIEERATSALAGAVRIAGNTLLMTNTDGSTKFGSIQTNASVVEIEGNQIQLMGNLDRPVLRLLPLVGGSLVSFRKNEFVSKSGIRVFANGDWLQKGAKLGAGLNLADNTHKAVQETAMPV